ncbi:MAG: oligopeptide transporter, OPT family [Rhodothermales bacterium]|nr:oligopeptide transporter, OPT family [Rhodothermales bacterium]
MSAPPPVVPPETDLPEFTVKAIVLGLVLAAVLGAANAYLGLKVGMTVSASIPAAVVSMGVLRLFKTSNILENNLVQTSASAGAAVAAGIIFTLPALLLMGYWQAFPFGAVMAIAALGGVLGVLFTIPMRRALLIERPLTFPEGVATGEVLKAGEERGAGVKAILVAALAAAAFKVSQTGLKIAAASAGYGVQAGRSVFGIGTDLGVALLAVGYIVGLNIGVLVAGGGALAWLVGIPLWMATASPADYAAVVGEATGYDAAFEVWSAQIRYLGVGAMVVGGLWAIVSLLGPIRDGVRSSIRTLREARAARASGEAAVLAPRTERDVPIVYVLGGALALAVPLFVLFFSLIRQDALGITSSLYWPTIAMAVVFSLVAGFLFSSVAGYMAGLVGSSNNPVSGITIATILSISGLLLVVLGSQIDFAVDTAQAAAAAATAVLVGAVVCTAAAIGGDNLQDLKAGQIVGATPWKQQVMLMLGAVAGALVMGPVLQLLFDAYGLGDVLPRPGMDPREALQAPQATLMASVARGVLGGSLPWGMIGIGAVVAVVLIAIDETVLARREARLSAQGVQGAFRAPILAVAVGMYLPLEVSVPIFLGGLVTYAVNRTLARRQASEAERSASERRGLLFASGIITGEALVGILLAIPFAIYQTTDVFAVSGMPGALQTLLGLAGAGAFLAWIYRVAAGRS